MRVLRSRATIAVALLLVVMSVGVLNILHNRQLTFMGGMAEEYFGLGVNLYKQGDFTIDGETPCLFRPPGYPFIISSTLKLRDIVAGAGSQTSDTPEDAAAVTRADYNAVCLAQCAMLATAAALIFLLLTPTIPKPIAFTVALAFGCNPYTLVMTGILHYGIAHIFAIVLSLYVLALATRAKGAGAIAPTITAGLVCGLATLVRPVMLILPPFVFLMCLLTFTRPLRTAFKRTVLFTVAMALAIAPWTYRNYRIAHRIIPVNAQSSISLWSATARELPAAPDHFKWWLVWDSEGKEIAQSATDNSYSLQDYNAEILRVEDKFAAVAALNLKTHPRTYLGNVLRNLKTLNVDINTVHIKAFQAVQQPGVYVEKRWFRLGHPQTFYPSYASVAVRLLVYALTITAALGVITALARRDLTILVPLTLYACICAAHSITYIGMMHYYVKFPFLFIFTAYFLAGLQYPGIRPSLFQITSPTSTALQYALITVTVAIIVLIQLKLPRTARPGALSAHRAVTASNVFFNDPTFGPNLAVDNDYQTRWATDISARQAQFDVDLGRHMVISSVTVCELFERIMRFEIQYKDGDAWKTILRGTRIGLDYMRQFNPVIARHVRLNVLDATAGPTICEFQLFGPDPLTKDKQATASSTFRSSPSYVPERAIDNDPWTRWATEVNDTDPYLQVDLGEPTTFNCICINEMYDRTRAFSLQYSQGDAWTSLLTGEIIGDDFYAVFSPVTASKLALDITRATAGPTFAEIRLYSALGLTTSKPISASSVYADNPDYGGEKATDNNPDTWWAADADANEAYLEVDLVGRVAVSAVRISERAIRTRSFELQRQVQGQWKPFFYGAEIGPDYYASFEPVTVDRVRLSILKADAGPSISEFQLFSPEP